MVHCGRLARRCVDQGSCSAYKTPVAVRLQFSVLGSGSRGNAVLVQAGANALLLDAGISAAQVAERMASTGCATRPEVILLTHEHADHVTHVRKLAEATGARVYGTEGTLAATAKKGKLGSAPHTVMQAGETFSRGVLRVEVVAKPHDAAEPVGFLVHAGEATLGFFTDLGQVDATVGAAIRRCTALILEANHDRDMLAAGPYPPWLRARVGGARGHLANHACMEALARHAGPGLREVVFAHLSSENNSPAAVRTAAQATLGIQTSYTRRISLQDRPTPLLEAAAMAGQAVLSKA